MTKNIIIGVLAVAVLVFGALHLFAPAPEPQDLGIGEVTGRQSYNVEHFHEGFYVGTGRQLNINRSGLLTTTGGITNTGTYTGTAGTFSTTLGVTGVFTPAGGIVSAGTLTQTGAFVVDSIGNGILIITNGGGGNTTSTAAVADICTNTTANWLATGVATLTFPGAVAFQADCLDTPGAYRDLKVRNTGAATTSVTFAAGASSTIHTASSTGTSVVEGGNYVWLRFEHVTSTVSDATMVEISVFEPFR